MKPVLVLCDGERPRRRRRDDHSKILEIFQSGRRQNLNLAITNISHRIVSDVDPIARDLLDIAAYIYHADSTESRWSQKDVFAEKWIRDFVFHIPVRLPGKWNNLRAELGSLLNFLTGDNFQFKFSKRTPRPEQLVLEGLSSQLPVVGNADSVCLFSGGLDSLAGAVALVRDGRRPLLVSHRSSAKIDSRQRVLAHGLQTYLPQWSFPRLNVWVNRKGQRANEQSQRSRSFLFLCLAAVTCYQQGLNEIYICENGTTTFNIPLSGQNIDTMLSRSTHPRFVKEFESFVGRLFSRTLQISNPFLFSTRRDVAVGMIGSGAEPLIARSVSCAHTHQSSIMHPHCGTCSQCVDRRFALAAKEVIKFASFDSYEKDLFIHDLKEGEERAHVESYVRSALRIEKMTEEQFFADHTELFDAIPFLDLDSDVAATKVFALFKKHATEVLLTLEEQVGLNRSKIVRNELPPHCLLAMLGSDVASSGRTS